MDLVGPARVCSAGGKWYVPVIVDDYSRYGWVFFLADKEMLFELFVVTMAVNLKTLVLKPFFMIWVSNISFLFPMWLVRMV
jgi:hypothetical protein